MVFRILFVCVATLAPGLLSGLIDPGSGPRVATSVSGDITVNTVWNAAGSPYQVTGDITVLNGVSLTIEPGVQVAFAAGVGLEVEGLLQVLGQSGSPVVLGSDEPSPQPGDWKGICFEADSEDATFDGGGQYISGCIIRYAEIRHAGPGISCVLASPYLAYDIIEMNSSPDGGGVFVMGAAVLEENMICDNRSLSTLGGGGVFFSGTLGALRHNQISDNYSLANGGGVCLHGEVETVGNVISGNKAGANGGGLFIGAGRPVVRDNNINNNLAGGEGGGVYCGDTAADVRNNDLLANEALAGGGGVVLTTTDVSFEDNTIAGNISDFGGGLNFNNQNVLNLVLAIPRNLFRKNSGYEIYNASSKQLDAGGCRFPGLGGKALAGAIYDHNDDYRVGEVLYNTGCPVGVIQLLLE